ncbi:glycosyl transferase [Alteromonas lipolytica]|uniref:Glycosyl transferase n=1 Tax=Alteromonas lipolytica TaxID=1856405 RepID=A0A1E8FCF1_9ALTE|nr:glycosyl transferase [Alteromonas lipolytica]
MEQYKAHHSFVRRVVRNLRIHYKRALWRFVIQSSRAVKRGLDIVLSLAAIVLLLPVYALTAIAIYVDAPGPVIFTQLRAGRFGKPFTMFKFRSMVVKAESEKAALLDQNESSAGVIFKMKRDPRITRVGRFIRKFSIDELPQLFNVLRGDMSLVGPRPPTLSEVAQYSLSDRKRLYVAPGITCIWQVSGRSEIDFAGQVKLDVAYIQSQSLWTDLRILLKTIPAVLLGKGAY